MKKLLLAAALSVAVVAPSVASAADTAAEKNAAKQCKAMKAAAGTNNFAAMYGTRKNAYGKCVSATAKKDAAEDAAQTKEAKSEAVQECRAMKTEGSKNAFGKCVSEKAKAKKDAADAEDKAQGKDRVNAARSCKTAKEDKAKFEAAYGTEKNAFGKCVSKTAREMAAERKAARTA